MAHLKFLKHGTGSARHAVRYLIGVITAPVDGSGVCPAWMARVARAAPALCVLFDNAVSRRAKRRLV